ncbi:MAG: amidase [Betaproteobacteria bacterium]|nr:amidase [Betaproteobacteria bacterium]MCC6247253.1 amidase [Rubrivivax sp.]
MSAPNTAIVDFHRHGVRELLAGYAGGTFTPIDAAEACRAAVARSEFDVHAWVKFDGERLQAAAAEATARIARGETLRALEGVPVGVKDIFNTTDFPTQMGSPLWSGFTPGNDARAVFHLKRAGALIPGKTVTAEFAVHTLGKTLNPWAAERTPGTSSSGSAVAVATGMVPVALGTQTAGSIVRPASFTGVWGMKPSFGLIPRTGMLKTTDSLDTVGFFVGHAADLQPVLDALRVDGRDYPISHAAFNDVQRQAAPAGRPWRVALLRPAVWAHAPAYARQAMEGWAWLADRTLGQRIEFVEPELPYELAECHRVHATIYNRALAYYFKAEHERAELVSPVMKALIEAGQQVTPAEYEAALERQVELARIAERFMRGFDVAVTLSTAGEAPPRHVEEAPDSALMWTLAQLPAVSAPAFRSPRGLPFGLQLVARRYNDPLLLKFVAEAVEARLLPAHSFVQPYGAEYGTAYSGAAVTARAPATAPGVPA